MSRIYFRSQDGGCAEIWGPERAYAARMTKELAAVLVSEPFTGELCPVARHLPTNWQQHLPRHWTYREKIANYLEGGFSGPRGPIQFGEHCLHGGALLANTALRLGSDAVKLLVRLHMSCEIHAWVDGPDRQWLSDLVLAGRRSGVLRAEMGWEGLAALLRQRDDLPVVSSYSVSGGFPNHTVAEWEPPLGFEGEPQDAWHEIPRERQWSLCMDKLRESEAADPDGMWLQLRPGNWDTYFYGAPLTLMDLNEIAMRERLAARKNGAQ